MTSAQIIQLHPSPPSIPKPQPDPLAIYHQCCWAFLSACFHGTPRQEIAKLARAMAHAKAMCRNAGWEFPFNGKDEEIK